MTWAPPQAQSTTQRWHSHSPVRLQLLGTPGRHAQNSLLPGRPKDERIPWRHGTPLHIEHEVRIRLGKNDTSHPIVSKELVGQGLTPAAWPTDDLAPLGHAALGIEANSRLPPQPQLPRLRELE